MKHISGYITWIIFIMKNAKKLLDHQLDVANMTQSFTTRYRSKILNMMWCAVAVTLKPLNVWVINKPSPEANQHQFVCNAELETEHMLTNATVNYSLA